MPCDANPRYASLHAYFGPNAPFFFRISASSSSSAWSILAPLDGSLPCRVAYRMLALAGMPHLLVAFSYREGRVFLRRLGLLGVIVTVLALLLAC